ncbi:MAG: serine/threonine protein kinase, partial [Myxococcales bacterium]|nr:serine/threonine protein kinase [Myxococcales bacterium]
MAMASQQQSLVAGDLLEGRYRIGELLGEGGYGRVYRAVQL